MGRDCGWRRGEASEPRRRAQPQGCGGQSGEIPAQRLGADQHSPAREACLLSRRGGQGLGAEARASVGSQGEDWGWRREHSLKGLAHHSWLGGSPGKSLQLPKRQETFSCLFVSRHARRGNELQRRARAAAISADPIATGVQREKWRDSRTEARRRAALTSPRGLSAHPPGRAGAGSRGSGFSRIAGRGLGLAA